jgi:hypothetical protein
MQESRRAETNANDTILRHERMQKRFTILIIFFTLSLLTFFYSQGKKKYLVFLFTPINFL